ncbi:MAG TPA: DUF4893 domain-containing protein [Sphingomicrobium sp.]|nr:DUF4893 domain-containing protein [Sphingomicrobium sp.]
MSMPAFRMGMTLLLALAASGCDAVNKKQVDRPRAVISVLPQTKSDLWLQIATPADQDRIARLGLAWQSAIADARRAGAASDLRTEGKLLEPLAALPRPAPTPGSYNCRLVKVGRVGARGPAFERFKPFFCYVEVEGDLLTIVKQTGSQRPAGRLWEDDRPDRLIFLGSLALGDEQAPMAYGDDPKRDMAGVLERVAPFVWRLVIPWPQGNSKLDVFELTPVANQPE